MTKTTKKTTMKQTDYESWFARSVGNWSSERRYLYGPKRKADNYKTKFSVNTEGPLVVVTWDGDMSDGEMKMTVEGNKLNRDIGYFTDQPTQSDLTLVDDDTLVMVTTYDGTTYREEIRMLFEDTVRLRQTVATSGDKITLVGQYFEERV